MILMIFLGLVAISVFSTVLFICACIVSSKAVYSHVQEGLESQALQEIRSVDTTASQPSATPLLPNTAQA